MQLGGGAAGAAAGTGRRHLGGAAGGASVELDAIADGSAWEVCEALFMLLALGDEACAGVAAALDPERTAGFRFRARAGELLARTGSLAAVPT